MFLALFLYALAFALYDLRARAATPDVTAVGLALLALAFSHPLGAAVAFTAAPFLVFVVRPALIANSAVNVVLTLIFHHLATPFVAVPDPLGEIGATDRLDRAFPDLFRLGVPGYHLIYHNGTWKLFEKEFDGAP